MKKNTKILFSKLLFFTLLLVCNRLNATPTSQRGNMLSLDGVNGRVSIPDNASLNIGTGQLTLAAWVKRDVVGTFDNIIMKGSYGYGLIIDDQDRLGYWSDFFYIDCFNSGSNTIPANVWTHIAVVVQTGAGGSTTLYINGVNVGTSINPAHRVINNNTDDLAFGTQDIGSCDCNNHGGNIDEVQIWNVALTQAQIRENMHLTRTGTETGLVAYYQFNEASGNVIDAVAGNNGTLQNGATRIPSSLSVSSGTSARLTVNATGIYNFTGTGCALNFTGTVPNGEVVVFRLDNPVAGTQPIGSSIHYRNHWVINNYGVNTTGLTVTPEFTLVSGTISAADAAMPSNLKLNKRAINSLGSFTQIDGIAANATTRVITFNTINSFSEFTISTIGTSVLPIKLLSFTGQLQGTNILLNWKMAEAEDGLRYELQHSTDGINFIAVNVQTGSATDKNFTHNDRNRTTGSNYYRLKITGTDGKVIFSHVLLIKNANNQGGVTVYPNPVKDMLHITGAETGSNLTLTDISGKIVLRIKAMQNAFSIDMSNYASGIYLLRNENGAATKIIKQ